MTINVDSLGSKALIAEQVGTKNASLVLAAVLNRTNKAQEKVEDGVINTSEIKGNEITVVENKITTIAITNSEVG